MGSIRTYVLCLCTLLPGAWMGGVCAQHSNLEFENFSQKLGKLHGQINEIAEDDLGYLWFGAANGLYRYDGYTLTGFHHDVFDSTTISSRGVIDLVVDKTGQVWSSSIAGVNRFDRKTQTFQRYLPYGEEGDAKRQNIVRDLFVDKDNDLWLAGHETLMKIRHGSSEFVEIFEKGAHGQRRNIRSISQAVDGQIWCATAEGLAVLSPSDTAMTYHRLFLPRDTSIALTVNEMIFISDLELLLSTPFGFFVYHTESGELTRDSLLMEYGQFNVSQIIEGRNNDFWIASRYGGLLHVTDQGQTQLYTHSDEDSRSLHTDEVVSSLVDQFGNLWVGTMTGVEKARINPGAIQLVVNSNKFYRPENRVSRVEHTNDGELWMLTRGGLFSYDGTGSFGQEYPGTSRLPFHYSICETSDGDIWIPANRNGLYLKPRDSDAFRKVQTDPSIDGVLVFKVVQGTEDPEVLWIGTTDGMARLHRRTKELRFFQPTRQLDVPSDHMIVFAQGDQQIWVYYSFAGQLGVFDKQSGVFELIAMSEDEKFMLEGVVKDAIVHDGNFWLATGHGLTRYDLTEGTFKMYTGSSGLSDSDIVTVFADSSDRLWAVGDQFIGKFDPESETFECYDFGNRVRSFSSKARTIAEDGTVWLGSMNGAFGFHPDSLRIDMSAPLVHLTNFEVNNTPVVLNEAYEYVDDITLDSDQNDITFGFTGVQLAAPDRVVYKCKLEGYDDDWTDLGSRRTKNYTNLDHGEYVFRVIAANQDGIWSEPGLVLPVEIRPPFTATIWFIELMVLAGGLFIFIAYKIWSHQQQLRREKAIAEKSAQYRAEFLAHTSHEVRTPLNAILGLSRLARESNDSEEKSRYVEAIESSSNNLLKIINDLLDHSKLESGTYQFKKEPFLLGELADQLAVLFETLASNKGLTFKVTRVGSIDSCELIGDELRLVQILTNLVGNAIKFTDKGSVELRLQLNQPHADKANVILDIIDTGVGIDPDALKDVFERFYESGARSGSGLGLYITRQLVEQQGGKIALDSVVGEGTRVTVRMPYEVSELTAARTQGQQSRPTLDLTLRILSVDDSPFNHLVLKEMLKKYAPSSHVETAPSGSKALDMVDSSDYDLIILDARMPEMDGFETARRLRAKGFTNPILGATASAMPEVLQQCLDNQMDDVITKPIDSIELIQKIEVLCGNLTE